MACHGGFGTRGTRGRWRVTAVDGARASGDLVEDPATVGEGDVREPLAVWVDCEQGESGCTGGDYVGFMVADGGSWVCGSCYWTLARDYHESRRGW